MVGAGGSHLTAAAGPLNMAVDHALLESVQAGRPPVLRLYCWSPACLSFGRNQHARESYDVAAITAAGMDVVRRPTGGLAVLHDRELTYCVLAPVALFGGPRAAYHAINVALVAGLRRLGLPADLAPVGHRRDPRLMAMEPCFQVPAQGEVTVAGRKLIGSAQRCESGVLLQHGSILLAGSQARVAALTRSPLAVTAGHSAVAAPVRAAEGSVTLSELLDAEPAIDDVARAIGRGFEETFGTCLAPARMQADELARAAALALHYADPEWTWRL